MHVFSLTMKKFVSTYVLQYSSALFNYFQHIVVSEKLRGTIRILKMLSSSSSSYLARATRKRSQKKNVVVWEGLYLLDTDIIKLIG